MDGAAGRKVTSAVRSALQLNFAFENSGLKKPRICRENAAIEIAIRSKTGWRRPAGGAPSLLADRRGTGRPGAYIAVFSTDVSTVVPSS